MHILQKCLAETLLISTNNIIMLIKTTRNGSRGHGCSGLKNFNAMQTANSGKIKMQTANTISDAVGDGWMDRQG